MKNLVLSLFLAGMAAAVLPCHASSPDDAPAEPLAPPSDQYWMCGTLFPGQSISIFNLDTLYSCNGKAWLTVKRGYAFLSDRIGIIWVAPAQDKPAFLLHMRHDGVLELWGQYGGRIWQTDTAGNPGARLVVNNDCTMGIYTRDNRAVFSTSTPCRVDMLEFMLGVGPALRDPEYGEFQQTSSTLGSGQFTVSRDPNSPRRWVRYGFDTDDIWVDRDTTGHALGDAYDAQPPRSMRIPKIWSAASWFGNRRVFFTTTLQYFDVSRLAACTHGPTLSGVVGEHRFRYAGAASLDGDLGILEVAIVDRLYHRSCETCSGQPVEAERLWFGHRRGLVRWEWWKDRTADPYWDSDNPDDIQSKTQPAQGAPETLAKRRTFNTFAPSTLAPPEVCPPAQLD